MKGATMTFHGTQENSITTPHNDPVYLFPSELAPLIRYSVKTLANLRSKGGGPPYYKRGSRILYEKHECLAWVQAQRKRHTSDDGLEPGDIPTGATVVDFPRSHRNGR